MKIHPLLALLVSARLGAQMLTPIVPIKPAGKPFIRSYESVRVPPLRQSNSARLHGMIRAGNLYLTAHDAVALAIENSLDLEVERYNIVIARWNVQRAESGGPLRGVTGANTSTISLGAGQGVAGSQRTSTGVGSGGTATIAGAALIQQIGSITPQLDPIYSATIAAAHQSTPQIQLVQSGTNELVDTARSYDFQLTEGLITGGRVTWNYNGSYLNEAVPTDVLNPTSFASMGFTLTHSLLSGFGERVNGRFIRVARRRVDSSSEAFRARLMAVVSGALNLYWDLALAASDLQYKMRNHEVARQFLADTDRQIAAGAVPAIDRMHALSAAAVQDQALVAAQNSLLARENAMKDALSWHGRQDAELAAVHIIPVDPLSVPENENLPPLAEMLATASQRRPDIAIGRAAIEMAEVNSLGESSVVLPTLRATVSTSNNGQTGTAVPGAGASSYFVGGASSALAQVFRRDFPNEHASLAYNAQLHKTLAQADVAIDQLQIRQTQLGSQAVLNQLAVEVSTQVLALEQARARYKAAVESRGLFERLLEGEEKKLLAGISTIATVVQSRRDLAAAQSSELTAAALYIRNRVALDQALGFTLEANHISVEDALNQ